MSNVKMSDVFENMIDFRLCEKGHIYCRFNDITDDALELVENAVISYDSNQELIAKLQADNELLREALASLASFEHERGGSLACDGSFVYKVSEHVFNKADKALAATAKG